MKTQEQIFETQKNSKKVTVKVDGKTIILSNVFNKDGFLNEKTKEAIKYRFDSNERKFYPVVSASRTYSDFTNYVISLCEYAGVKYSTGNDAPRGGRTGEFVQVSKKAADLFKSLR